MDSSSGNGLDPTHSNKTGGSLHDDDEELARTHPRQSSITTNLNNTSVNNGRTQFTHPLLSKNAQEVRLIGRAKRSAASRKKSLHRLFQRTATNGTVAPSTGGDVPTSEQTHEAAPVTQIRTPFIPRFFPPRQIEGRIPTNFNKETPIVSRALLNRERRKRSARKRMTDYMSDARRKKPKLLRASEDVPTASAGAKTTEQQTASPLQPERAVAPAEVGDEPDSPQGNSPSPPSTPLEPFVQDSRHQSEEEKDSPLTRRTLDATVRKSCDSNTPETETASRTRASTDAIDVVHPVEKNVQGLSEDNLTSAPMQVPTTVLPVSPPRSPQPNSPKGVQTQMRRLLAPNTTAPIEPVEKVLGGENDEPRISVSPESPAITRHRLSSEQRPGQGSPRIPRRRLPSEERSSYESLRIPRRGVSSQQKHNQVSPTTQIPITETTDSLITRNPHIPSSMKIREKEFQRHRTTARDIQPRCFNSNSTDVRPVVEALESTGLMPFVNTCKRAFAMEQRCGEGDQDLQEMIEETNPYPLTSGYDRWSYSYMYEMAAEIIKQIGNEELQRLPYFVRTRARSEEGIFIDVVCMSDRFASDPRPPQQFDVILDCTRDGSVLVGINLGSSEDFNIQGYLYVILDWYDDGNLKKGLYKVCNLRHQFTMFRALDSLKRPTTPMMRTIATLMDGDSNEKNRLIRLAYQAIPPASPDTKSRAAMYYISQLKAGEKLNEQQSEAIKQSLDCLRSYARYGMDGNASRQLQRFLVVSGVPGCGKTHTAVYMIATFVTYMNPEVLRHQHVPYWAGQILVLTKTNRALDVFMDRIERIPMPSRRNRSRNEDWSRMDIPYYCKRSLSYLSRPDVENVQRSKQTEDPRSLRDVPVMLSTFGNLLSLYYAFRNLLGSDDAVDDWIREHLKAIIIDESSQCTLLDLLIFIHLFPSFNGIVIFMGDPRQMGPVVLTTVKEARDVLTKNIFSELSANERLFVPSASMCIQYRMHKQIMALANDVAYNRQMVYGRKDENYHMLGTNLARSTSANSASYQCPALGPVVVYTTSGAPSSFFNCEDYVNKDELRLAEELIAFAVSTTQLRNEDFVFLSPYKQQCEQMRERSLQLKWRIRVQTVASFQGQEGSVVIYSLVRRKGSGSGFLDQDELLNVAITRPIQSLIIIGDMNYLKDNVTSTTSWKDLLNSVHSRRFPILPAHQFLPF